MIQHYTLRDLPYDYAATRAVLRGKSAGAV
jgi:hypothetical protein